LNEIVDKIVSTLISVAISVGLSAGLWVGINLLFQQATVNWRKFQTIATALVAFTLVIVLDGNRALKTIGPRSSVVDALDDIANLAPPLTMALLLGVVGLLVGRAVGAYRGSPALMWPIAAGFAALGLVLGLTRTDNVDLEYYGSILWWPLIAAAIAGLGGWVIAGTVGQGKRRPIGAGIGAGFGLLLGAFLDVTARPEIEPVGLVIATLAGAAIAGGVAKLRGNDPIPPALIGTAFGWMIGAFALPDVGGGSTDWALIATMVPLGLIGLRVGWNELPSIVKRARIDARARAWIFLGPAVAFISWVVIVPVIRTAYLSLRGEQSESFVGLENYG